MGDAKAWDYSMVERVVGTSAYAAGPLISSPTPGREQPPWKKRRRQTTAVGLGTKHNAVEVCGVQNSVTVPGLKDSISY